MRGLRERTRTSSDPTKTVKKLSNFARTGSILVKKRERERERERERDQTARISLEPGQF